MDDGKMIRFGCGLINRKRLKQNFLSVMSSTGKSYRIKPTLIQNDLKNLLLNFDYTGKVGLEDYQKLGDASKQMFHRLLEATDNEKLLGLKFNHQDDLLETVQRFEVLKGLLLAGNDGKELLRELKMVVLRLVNSGKLPQKQSIDFLMELMLLLPN